MMILNTLLTLRHPRLYILKEITWCSTILAKYFKRLVQETHGTLKISQGPVAMAFGS